MTADAPDPAMTERLALAERRLRRAEAAQAEAEALLERISRELDRSNHELRQRESDLIAKLDIGNRNLIRAQRTAQLATIYREPGTDFLWSPQLAEMLGLPPGASADGDDILHALHPFDRTRIEMAAATFFASEVAAHCDHRYECRIIRIDGAVRWLRWILRRDPAEGGDVVSGTVQDITEQRAAERRVKSLQLIGERNLKRLQRTEIRLAERVTELERLSAELRASNDAAAAASRAKSQLLAAMSHQIRTPMNGVLGMMTALRRTALDAGQRAQLDRAQDAGDALRVLIDNIIDVADGTALPGNFTVPAPAVATTVTPLRVAGRRPRILVADDIETNRIVLTSMLDTLGCDHRAVEDGAQALAAAQDGDIDAILMDIQMPVMDGAEATRQTRQLPGTIGTVPIIGVTAQAIQAERDALTAAGMTACLAKPIGVPVLAAALAATFAARDDEVIDAAAFSAAFAVLPPERRRLVFDQMERDFERLATEFGTAVAAGDADAVGRARHSLTGVASAFGAKGLTQLLESTRTSPLPDVAQAADLAALAQGTIAVGRSLLRNSAAN
ncbi:MAG TPA: response regulator [Polymorphobacter sp.]|nr:response regulator [Polymorphobacter sp.]